MAWSPTYSFLVLFVWIGWCFPSIYMVSLIRSSSPSISASKLSQMQTVSDIKLGASFAQQYLLTNVGTIGKGGGRSEIHDCIQAVQGTPVTSAVPLTLKIVREDVRFDREKRNYEMVCGSAGSLLPHFVRVQRFEKNAKSGTNCIVMEKGTIDLKKAIAKSGSLRGSDFTRTAKAMTAALEKIHSKGLVWTDLKLDNFVLVNTGNTETDTNYFGSNSKYVCKAIDLESCVRQNTPLVDFSPESMAPEQLERLQGGTLSSLTNSRQSDLTFSTSQPLIASKETDVWALGIALLHMYLGKAPISDRPGDVRSAMTRVQSYIESNTDLGLSTIKETPIRVLLTSMLDKDVRKRPPLKAVAITLNIC